MRKSAMWTRTAKASLLALAVPAAAVAQDAAGTSRDQIEEIIVTAEKREQSANTVGISITAATGDVLKERGIDSVADLTRLVPGLTIQESAFNSTSFTLRGVGFFNSDLATPPAVTVYVDEAPLPYPAMTKLAAFDLARVEVLKGPQGTLFGQNATGGAVNYIAAKPTEAFESGVDVTYGRFNHLLVGGFVSGPIDDHLRVRIAVQAQRGDAWQQSITRPGDQLGKVRKLEGRATLEWAPGARFSSRLTITATHDGSDSPAAQFIAPVPRIPPLLVPGLLTFPVIMQPRAADWTPLRPGANTPFPYTSDTTLFQTSWRNDYKLNDDVAITSLTSYAQLHLAYGQDGDGTPFDINEIIDDGGMISSFFQELRVAGRGVVNWLVGANYTHDNVTDQPLNLLRDTDVCRVFEGVDPQAFCDDALYISHMHVNTYAVFGRTEYTITDQLMLEGAVRYNDDRRTFNNCSITVSDHFARYWNLFRGGAEPTTTVGECFILDPANALMPVDNVHNTLNEASISWRTGLNWTPQPRLLLYANLSQGYKAGTVPVVGASTVVQFTPVPQEFLLAYEAGIKAGMFDNRIQLNTAAFYYDYKDKQLRGAILDPTFGPLEALVSIPQSHVDGFEVQLVARLIEGLTIDAAANYLETKVDRFTGFDALANYGDQAGTPFPFTPKWQSITNIDYAFPLSGEVAGFVGASLTYNSQTFAGVGALDVLQIGAFTLLDLRAGIEFGDGRYRVWAWGRNVTNEYYWSNVLFYNNAISRFVGQPATFGISLSARF